MVHTGWPETDIMILPGVEITTCLGHFNIFGCTGATSQLLDIMKEAGEEDIWKWLYYDLPLKHLHLMEIVNDPTYGYAPEANDEAVSFLDYLWKHGYVVFGLGGSDSHNLESERYEGATEPSIPGDPATLVYMNGLSPDHLMQGVAAGHVIVCRYIRAEVSFYYHGGQYLPGDRIETGNAAGDLLYCKGSVTGLPEEVMVVGDSPTDMEFAHNSGGLAVGVLSGVGSREELKGMADILIPSVDVLDQLEAIYTGKTTEWKAIYR